MRFTTQSIGLVLWLMAIAFWSVGVYAEETTSQTQPTLVQFDLGTAQWHPNGVWNQLSDHEVLGVLCACGVDTEGRATTLMVRQIDGWAGINTLGNTRDGPYPPDVMRDSFYLGDGDRHAALRLEGLVPNSKYDLTFFGSRIGGNEKRTGKYTVGKQSASLDAANNHKQAATIEQAVADENGQLLIEVDCPQGEDYAYLGALVVAGELTATSELLLPPDPLDGPPLLTCAAWIVGDGETGQPLWGNMQEVPRQMASTTKMMTALLVLEQAEDNPGLLDEVVTVSTRADRTGGSTAGILAGERYLVSELLYGLLLPSGNDAAVALAEHVGSHFPALPKDAPNQDADKPDTLDQFVAAMNAKAGSLGMKATMYFDPHGNSANRSSAHDLLRLAHEAMQRETFRQYVRTRNTTVQARRDDETQREVTWNNTNKLLGIEGFDGIKTGTTGRAGACLVSSGRRDGVHLFVVVLGSTSTSARYVDSRNLYRWAWRQKQKEAQAAGD